MRGQAGLNAGSRFGEILSVGAERPNQRPTKDSRINATLFALGLAKFGPFAKGWCAVDRDQQIRKALELLAPPTRERAECQHDIGLALDRVEHGAAVARSFRVAGSTKGKAGLKRYYAALRRLRNAYNSLDPAIRPWFSLGPGKSTVITAVRPAR